MLPLQPCIQPMWTHICTHILLSLVVQLCFSDTFVHTAHVPGTSRLTDTFVHTAHVPGSSGTQHMPDVRDSPGLLGCWLVRTILAADRGTSLLFFTALQLCHACLQSTSMRHVMKHHCSHCMALSLITIALQLYADRILQIPHIANTLVPHDRSQQSWPLQQASSLAAHLGHCHCMIAQQNDTGVL